MGILTDSASGPEPSNQSKGSSSSSQSRTPRLVIKEMVMRNFKSYAEEQRVGPFHKSFSAVVGPNGSGKSNVIDAMLFVFGKRAKQMRLNKVSELIHNSTNHQNLDRASVSVHFHEIIDMEGETFESVSGSDFVITRAAFRDNSSKYYINDRVSNFTEVTKKLKGKGVDLDNNRFLILQGEVEQISLMKPKAQGPHDEGFLEYLEDIIGTDKYVEKIEEFNKQLESFNDKRSGVVQMVKLAEKERDSLENGKNEAESYMLRELTLLKWREKATKLAAEDAASHVVELQTNVSSLEENLKNEREKIRDNTKALKELETVHNRHMKKQVELDNNLKTCKDEFKEFERQDLKHREDLKHMKQKVKKLVEKLEKDSSKIEEISKESEESASMIPKLEAEIPKLQQLLVDEEKMLEQIKESCKGQPPQQYNMSQQSYPGYPQQQTGYDQTSVTVTQQTTTTQGGGYDYYSQQQPSMGGSSASVTDNTGYNYGQPQAHVFNYNQQQNTYGGPQQSYLQDGYGGGCVETERNRIDLNEVRAELDPWEKQLIEHKGKLDVACAESKLLKEKHQASRVALEDAQRKMNDITEDLKVKGEGIKKTQSDFNKIKNEAVEARKVEQECLREQDSLIPLEQAARQKVTELLSVTESERSEGSVIKAILQAKESNSIEGIHGRMGDLGAIDAKYDIAISTACAGLDYIVVETTGSAQACVELLRRKNLGVATFMILDKQEEHSHKLREKVSTPEGVPRLFDLVKVRDDRMKLAFFAALKNTVVAKDLDQATRIAYGGNKEFGRVVTLDGALFEKSGTMSGGGGKPRGGKMGAAIRAASVSAESMANAEKELAKLVDQLSALRKKISDSVRCYQASEKEVSRLEMELAKSQKEIESLSVQNSYIEKQLDSLKAASHPSKDELDRLVELNTIISSEEKELGRLTKGSKKLKEKALELQNKIENAGGETLRKQNSKVIKIQSDIDKNSTEINRHKVQIATGEKMTKKLTKAIEESNKERDRLVDEKEKMLGVFKEIEQKAFIVQDNYKKTQELIEQHREVLDGAKENYNKLKKTMDEMRATEVDVDYKFQDMKKLSKEWEVKGKAYQKKLEDVQNDLVKHMELIQKDGVDAEKLRATLGDESFSIGCDLKRALERVQLLETQLKEMNPNLDSISEYRKRSSLYAERVEELNTITQERDDIKKQYDEMRKKRQVQLDEFMAGFNTISLKLKEMYQMITLGGDAELELVDSLDPFAEGVVFSVRPPKKSWKNIANLSGGEKTLSSLALVFALHHYKPTPLYVMDEIDAALDFKNVSIVGHYVKDRTKDAQFIIISLRNNMFELADRLVGIYKTDNCTKSITINPGSFAVSEKAAC
ncbi:hypothetical protein GIB67_030023 [Kingdonia uniflora]|uniref:Structural maintenance of chromosomes protein n=1 Tax=Kingdonia uniflora TaxID=39325 RepID=A0A7J7MXW7_9MAGN|nr:hypothetical protein GIB67_030023 [Kingdonia uniflora]